MALLLRDGDELGRQILSQWHAIGQWVAVQETAGIVIDHALEQGLAQSHEGSTVFLPLAHQRIERAAGITAGHQFQDIELAGLGIDLDLHCPPADLPEHALRFERGVVIQRRLEVAIGGKFIAGAAEVAHHQRHQRLALHTAHNDRIFQRQLAGRGVHFERREFENLALECLRGAHHRAPHHGNGRAGIGALIKGCEVSIDFCERHSLGARTQHFGHQLRERRVRALPDLHRTAVQEHIAVGGHLDARLRRLVDAATVLEANGEADTALFRPEAATLAAVIPNCFAHDVETKQHVAVYAAFARHEGFAQFEQVVLAHLVGIDREAPRDHVELRLRCPACLGAAEAAKRPRRRGIGHHAGTARVNVAPAVGPRNAVAGLFCHQGAGIRVGTSVEQDLAVARDQGAVGHHTGFETQNGCVLRVGEKTLFHRQAQAHRLAGHQ